MDRQLSGEVSQSQLAATVRGGRRKGKMWNEGGEKWKKERGGACAVRPRGSWEAGWSASCPSSGKPSPDTFWWHNYQQAFLCLQGSQQINLCLKGQLWICWKCAISHVLPGERPPEWTKQKQKPALLAQVRWICPLMKQIKLKQEIS